MIDLHSHLLPGVDDGSKSVEQSVRVLERLAEQGVTGVCLTPHLLASVAALGVPESQDRAFQGLRLAAPSQPALYRGAEVMLDRPLDASVAEHRRLTLNGSRYILVEFPRLVAAQTVAHALELVTAIGLVPLLAHPERYRCCRPEVVRRWKANGALMQLDGPTLLSPRPRGARARELLEAGLGDVIAADNHGDDRSLATVAEAMQVQGGTAHAEQLLVENPRAIVEDREVEPVPGFSWRVSIADRIRALLGGGEDGERS